MLNRPIVFGDIHWGLYSDSKQHTQDCSDYIDWLIVQFHEQKCDSVFFLGDWFHNQVHVQWDTLWASQQAIEKLAALDVPVYWLLGNHDLQLKYSRDMHSHAGLHWVKNVHLIDEITQVDDILFCPYLMGAEYNRVANTKADYVFGHFNMSGFMVNENWEMTAAEGGLNPDLFSPRGLYSGHFHKRQQKQNANGTDIVYIGNAFPHTFNDAGDRDRGCMVFDRDEPVFLNWDRAPTYDYVDLSALLIMIDQEHLSTLYGPRATLHVRNDIDLDDPDLSEVRDFMRSIGLRHVKIDNPYTPSEEDKEVAPIPAPRENITEYFYTGLNQVDTVGSKYRLPLLQDLFKKAMEKHDRGETV